MSALEVGRLSAEGSYAVGVVAGLQLQIMGGAKSWILRTTIGNKRRRMGLGPFPQVTLADARAKARKALEAVESGSDPIEQRRQAKAMLIAQSAKLKTFDWCAEQFIADKGDEWRNPKHRQQWTNTLATYASPVIGAMKVRDISLEHVEELLRPIWKTKTETATRVRGRVEAVLDWATVARYREGPNPAAWKGNLEHKFSKPSKISQVEHHEALSIDAVPAFISRLDERSGMGARALRFLILTAARSGEVRGATWSEIDLDERLWIVPGVRMKAGREHRVPLSRQAVELLKSLPTVENTDVVFPGIKGQSLSDMTLTKVMRDMKETATPHGFRSTFRDWAAERTDFPSHVAEMALAHTIESKVEAAYRRGDLLAKRTQMAQAWADFCCSTESKGRAK